MLRRPWCALALLVVPATAAPAAALEKAAGRAPAELDEFRSSATVTITYYNVCTGWVWLWSGAPPQANYGVFYDDPSPEEDRLLRTNLFYEQGAPSGYGFTSIARVLGPFSPFCPAISLLDFEFFLPQAGWNTIEWNGTAGIPVEDFWVLVTHGLGSGNPTVIVTEKGQAGATPGGCGVCFEPSRPVHSFQFGQGDVFHCPGGPWLDQSPCFLELLWTSEVRTGSPVGVETLSWGRVKGLYR